MNARFGNQSQRRDCLSAAVDSYPPTEIVKIIAEIDEYKRRWHAFDNLSSQRLQAMRKAATVESVGSSSHIEGDGLTDIEVETLLSNIESTAFLSRDEQEVADYAETMDLIFE